MRGVVMAILLCGPVDFPKPREVAGLWEGALEVGAIKLRLAFAIEKKPDGSLAAKMDSPDQGAKGLPVKSVNVEGDQVTLDLSNIKAEFIGKFSADGAKIAGDWKQSGRTFPLELRKVEKLTEVKRPQHPQPPYPYAEEPITVENSAAQVKLAGTLTKPKTGGPFPAVILVSGSGPQDRDESILGHKPFLVIADHLTRAGIAVLRYDDRGVGKSTGKSATATTADFATDAHAVLKHLRGRADIDPQRVGIIGHSEGGLIAPIVAAAHPDDVNFIVLLAGPGVPGDEVLADQLLAILRAEKVKEPELKLRVALQKAVLEVAKSDVPAKELPKALAAAAKKYLDSLSPEDRKLMEKETGADEKDLAALASPWMVWFLKHDPRPTLKKVRCPVLALNGEVDVQVTQPLNTDAVRRALEEGGNRRATVRVLPGLNHLFQSSKSGAPSEYGTLEETFSPVALEAMTRWILELKP